MPQELTNLRVKEVSLVDRPANAETDPLTGEKIARARVALFKQDANQGDQPSKGAQMLTLEQIEKKVQEQDALLAKMAADEAASKAENGVLKAEIEVLKMSAKEKKAFGGFSAKQKEDYMAADTEKRKKMMGDACKGDDNDEDDDTKKRDAEVKASADRIAKLEADRATDAARIAKAESELADARKRDRLAVFVNKADKELPNTAGSSTEKGETLMKMADALGGEESDGFKKFFAAQKEADKILAENRFREFGKWGGGTGNSAEAQLSQKAEEISKRDKINKQAAFGKAMLENPDLFRQMQTEQRTQ